MPLHQPDPDLTDGTVTLRRWEPTDLRCVELAATDPDIPRGTTVPARYSEEAALAFVARQRARLTDGQGLSLAVARAAGGAVTGAVTGAVGDAGADEAVGLVVLMHRAWAGTVELGYWLVPTARGHGLAARAVRLVSAWALTATDVARIEALVRPDNEASLRTLASAGFVREGVARSALPGREAPDGPDERSDAVVWSRVVADLARA